VAETIGYLLAQSFNLSSSQTMATTDDRGGPTNRVLASGWYRTLLANGAGTAHTDPAELLAAVETALGSTKWTVALNSSGKVAFTYNGIGTGEIDFASALTLRALLGLDANVGPVNAGATATATYSPTHVLMSTGGDPDSGWIDMLMRFSGAAMPDGTVYGWHDGRVQLRRSITMTLLPKDWATRTSLSAVGTPAFGARLQSPATGEPAQAPPWSVLDTMATAFGVECGMSFGYASSVIAGTVTDYDKVYLAPEMASGGGRVSLTVPGYDPRRNVALELLYAGAGSV
jgi:hypothetical protein